MNKIKSKPLKWHGGKGGNNGMAKWIHGLAPPSIVEDSKHGYNARNYPFAGGLGEFWNWEPEGISEAVNDIYEHLMNFWCVLASEEMFAVFKRLIDAIPLSQEIWENTRDLKCFARETRAAEFFVKYRQSRQGLGKVFMTPTTRTRRGMNENVSAWLSAVDGLPECHERLRRVEIRNMDAVKFIRQYDHPRALFVCDPPYVATDIDGRTVRTVGNAYVHEMDNSDHVLLCETARLLKGAIMICGYPTKLYSRELEQHGFVRHDKATMNSASGRKVKPKVVESIWCNYS